jgi:hypothetical protein
MLGGAVAATLETLGLRLRPKLSRRLELLDGSLTPPSSPASAWLPGSSARSRSRRRGP